MFDQDVELMGWLKPYSVHSQPKIICLCGSTRFYKSFQAHNYLETMRGNIVLSVGFFPYSAKEVHGEDVGCTDEEKKCLDQLHLRKIDLCDEVFVLNVDGYIGESTANEIVYANLKGKPVRFLENKFNFSNPDHLAARMLSGGRD